MSRNRIAIVTGSSRGIGAATAEVLAKLGYAVCVNYVADEASAELIVTSLKKNGARAIAVKADVSREKEVEHLFDRVDKELGMVTALVNNAGILKQQTRVEDMDEDRINTILTTNVTSAFLCCKHAINRMSSRHNGSGGAIVNISSAASRIGSPGEYVDYAASKGAIDSLTRGLSLEVADEGIRVNCVRPGVIYTDMHTDGGEPGRVDRVAASVPMKRGGQPIEVANAVAWLLSDEASYVTGTFVEASGGR